MPKNLINGGRINSLNIFNQSNGSHLKKNILKSSYQEDFMKKSAKKIDFKSLDCYRDKIIDLDVSYNEKHNRKITNR